MTTFDWTTAIAECCTYLAGLGNLPPPAKPDPSLAAIAVLSLIADIQIQHALTPHSTVPLLVLPRYSGRHDLVDDILAELTAAVAAPARGNFDKLFSVRDWIAQKGLDAIVLRSVEHAADDHGRAQLLGHTAQRAHALLDQLARLRDRHIRQLLRRDIPELDEHCDWHSFDPNPIGWLLAHHYGGDKARAVRVTRRFQALRLYASIADTLREPAITEAIDAGHELVPVLMNRLTFTRGQLRALREAAPPQSFATYRFRSFEKAALHLRAHNIPLHRMRGEPRRCAPGGMLATPAAARPLRSGRRGDPLIRNRLRRRYRRRVPGGRHRRVRCSRN
jgi:hypothetical protein